MKIRFRIPKRIVLGGLAILVFLMLTVSIVVPRLINHPGAPLVGNLLNTANPQLAETQKRFAEKDGGQATAQELSGRKEIYDRNWKEVAVNIKRAAVFVKPYEFQNIEVNGRLLAGYLNIKENDLLLSLKSRRNVVCLGKKFDPSLITKIQELNLPGVYIQPEDERYYPFHQTAAHVVGFTRDGQGLDGIEFQYDNLLRQHAADKSPEQGGLPEGNLVLTLDLRIQSLLEKRLDALRSQAEAESATAVIMDPSNGAVLAIVNTPAFDPNRFWEYGMLARRNQAIFDPLQPGTINNLFSLAAAIEAGDVKISLPVAVPAAEKEKKNKAQAKTSHRKKEIKVSLNKTNELVLHPDWSEAGAKIYVSSQRGFDAKPIAESERLSRLAQRLGFQAKSPLDLPTVGFEEGSKVVTNTGRYSIANPRSETTALHLVTALSTLINGGHSVTPHLLAELWEPKTGSVKPVDLNSGQAVLSQETSQSLLALLANSERIGPANSYFLESLVPIESAQPQAEENKSAEDTKKVVEEIQNAADRTSKAQAGENKVVEEVEKQEEVRYQAVMMGMVPVNAPTLVMLVVLNKARVDLGGPSPLRLMGLDILPKVVTWTGIRQSPPSVEQLAEYQEELVESWRQFESRADEVKPYAGLDEAEPKMPDLEGTSLRRALQILQTYNLEVKVQGAGRVVKQFPEAGRILKGKRCVLELRMDS